MNTHLRPVSINIASIPVDGVGGVGMLAMAAIIAVAFPEGWFLALSGAIGGLIIACALIGIRGDHLGNGPMRGIGGR